MNTLRNTALSIALVSACGLVMAQPVTRAGNAPGVNAAMEVGLGSFEEFMKMADLDRDGMISRDEHMKMAAAYIARMNKDEMMKSAAASFDRMAKMPNGMVDGRMYFMQLPTDYDPFRPGPYRRATN